MAKVRMIRVMFGNFSSSRKFRDTDNEIPGGPCCCLTTGCCGGGGGGGEARIFGTVVSEP